MLPLLLSCKIICLLEPGNQLFVNFVDGVHANAMGEQRIEAGSVFESLCRGYALEINPMSIRVDVVGWIIANFFLRRKLTYPFFGACSMSLPNEVIAVINASWRGFRPAFLPLYISSITLCQEWANISYIHLI